MKTLTVMSALQTLIEKSKAKQSTFFELLGFVVLSAGIFCGLALFTYDPGDPTQITTTGETYRNMGGPVGAWLANSLLSTLGMVSLLIAIVLFFCGALMALGFIRWPKPKRFVGFAVILVVLAGYMHTEHPNSGTTNLPHGLGGVIGTLLGDTLLKSIGYGGAVIGLTFRHREPGGQRQLDGFQHGKVCRIPALSPATSGQPTEPKRQETNRIACQLG